MAHRRFLIELPHADIGFDQIEAMTRRARQVAERLNEGGYAVRFVRAVGVPEDGSCLLIWEGDSLADVEAAVRLVRANTATVTEATRIPSRG